MRLYHDGMSGIGNIQGDNQLVIFEWNKLISCQTSTTMIILFMTIHAVQNQSCPEATKIAKNDSNNN